MSPNRHSNIDNFKFKSPNTPLKASVAILTAIILSSCGSDELTKSKAEYLIRDCEKKVGKPAIKTTSFDYGRIEVVSYGNTKYDSKMKIYTK